MFVQIARKVKSGYVEMYTVILPMCLCFHSDFVSRINVIMLVWSYTPEGWPSGNLYWSVMSRRVTSPGALVKTMRPTWVRFTLTGSMVPSLLREWNTTSLLTCREKEHWLKHTKNTGLHLTWAELNWRGKLNTVWITDCPVWGMSNKQVTDMRLLNTVKNLLWMLF